MSNEQRIENDGRALKAANELGQIIHGRFPQAQLVISRGEDPDGIYLDAIVDLEDPDEVMDLVIDRLLELRVEQGIPVHVLPQRPTQRSLEAVKSQRAKWSWARHHHTHTEDPSTLHL
jgi:hypothetical protein